MKGGRNMNSELEKLKKELELALQNPNIDMEELTQISCKIDEEIEKKLKKRLKKMSNIIFQ